MSENLRRRMSSSFVLRLTERSKWLFPPTSRRSVNPLQSSLKIASIGLANSREIRNASGSEGSYFPVSIALTLWREMPSRSARSAWDQLRSARRTLSRLFICKSIVRRHPRCQIRQSSPPRSQRVAWAAFRHKPEENPKWC